MGEVRHTTDHNLILLICISLIINMKKQRKKINVAEPDKQHTYSSFDIICYIIIIIIVIIIIIIINILIHFL